MYLQNSAFEKSVSLSSHSQKLYIAMNVKISVA